MNYLKEWQDGYLDSKPLPEKEKLHHQRWSENLKKVRTLQRKQARIRKNMRDE